MEGERERKTTTRKGRKKQSTSELSCRDLEECLTAAVLCASPCSCSCAVSNISSLISSAPRQASVGVCPSYYFTLPTTREVILAASRTVGQ